MFQRDPARHDSCELGIAHHVAAGISGEGLFQHLFRAVRPVRVAASMIVFTSLLSYNYFNFLTHDLTTRNSGAIIALPKVKLDFARKRFYFSGTLTFNSLPLKIQVN